MNNSRSRAVTRLSTLLVAAPARVSTGTRRLGLLTGLATASVGVLLTALTALVWSPDAIAQTTTPTLQGTFGLKGTTRMENAEGNGETKRNQKRKFVFRQRCADVSCVVELRRQTGKGNFIKSALRRTGATTYTVKEKVRDSRFGRGCTLRGSLRVNVRVTKTETVDDFVYASRVKVRFAGRFRPTPASTCRGFLDDRGTLSGPRTSLDR